MPDTTFDIEVIAAADLGVVPLPDGKAVFSKGDEADCAYIVKSGSIEIRGADCAIEIVGPGELFGTAALIDDQRRFCSAVAVGESEVIAIPRSLFQSLLRDDSDFALTIISLVVRRLRATLAQLDGSRQALPVSPATGTEPSRVSA
ncbi:MAG: Crp/Fnr family transcriptional regulator [Bauldia sp.]|nr:Crp/Fnr family transcriptional regulator [Bauldia sp.]